MDLLKIIFERAGALNGIWNLYIAVAFGVVGIMASGKSFTTRTGVKLLLIAAFVVFAIANVLELYFINQQRFALIELVDTQFIKVANQAKPLPNVLLFLFHGILDAIVI